MITITIDDLYPSKAHSLYNYLSSREVRITTYTINHDRRTSSIEVTGGVTVLRILKEFFDNES